MGSHLTYLDSSDMFESGCLVVSWPEKLDISTGAMASCRYINKRRNRNIKNQKSEIKILRVVGAHQGPEISLIFIVTIALRS